MVEHRAFYGGKNKVCRYAGYIDDLLDEVCNKIRGAANNSMGAELLGVVAGAGRAGRRPSLPSKDAYKLTWLLFMSPAECWQRNWVKFFCSKNMGCKNWW